MLDFTVAYNNGFLIKFNTSQDRDEEVDNDDFQESVDYMKSFFLRWDQLKYGWLVPDNRIEEIIGWFDRNNNEFSITLNASNK